MAKVSIVVPVYNIEAYLRRCVDSLIAQTLKEIEIILVDDGSTDLSGAICDEYADRYQSIKVIHKANGGLSDARNAGIDAANGDFIGFADGDDWAKPEMFEALYRACIENQVMMSACDRSYRTRKEAPDLCRSMQQCQILTSEEFFGEVLKHGDTVSMGVWNKLYNRHLFDEIRFPIGKMHEDNATLYRLIFQTDKIAYIPVQYYIYEKRPGSITLLPYGSKEYDRYEADHAIYLYIASAHPNMLPLTAKYLCISNLTIARNMVMSGVHDNGMYRKTKKENMELLPVAQQEGLLSRKEKLELRIMCTGYYPYKIFLRLRQIRGRLIKRKYEVKNID